MEIITPSRGDLLSIHNNNHPIGFSAQGGLSSGLDLLPSIMPPPDLTLARATAPPTASRPYPLPAKLERGSLVNIDVSGKMDTVKSWRKHVEPELLQSIHPPSPARSALRSVNLNTTTTGLPSANTASSSKHVFAIPTRPISAIPRPAAQPDVFASETSYRIPSRFNDNVAQNARAKRVRESSNQSQVKRPKVDLAAESARARKVEEEKWTAKWLKVFPTLVFYFEAGVEDGAGRPLKQRVLKMGAKVDQFFSHKVSHLIVKGAGSPQKARPLLPSKRLNALQEQFRPNVNETGLSDLAVKAEGMGMKVWTLKKLGEILSRIAPVELAAADSLRTLLEDERVNGTRERDLSAPRPDHYYFKPGNKYTLIEDATGRHRTIMVKEYQPNGKDAPEWPVLHDSFLRVSAANVTDTPIDKLRDRAWSLYVDREPFEDEQPPGELRRATSMRNISGTPRLPNAAPYQNASGNSVVITSNIASTSCANPSPFMNGIPGLGSAKDRAIMQMSKRVQVLKGNAALAAARRLPQPDDIFAIPQPRRASTGMPPQAKTFMTQDQVVKMLRQSREPVKENYVSYEVRYANHQKVYGQGRSKEQDTAPGYCENCRLRYSDLSIHLASKKHRRFAQNDSNFADLDRLLITLQRRPVQTDDRIHDIPCHEPHHRDYDCERCTNNVRPESDEDDDDDEGELFDQDQELEEEETEGDCEEEGSEED